MGVAAGTDIVYTDEKLTSARAFANKIWNAARFILMNLEGYTPHAIKREELPLEDRWILSRLAATTQAARTETATACPARPRNS